jgi:pyrroloquinoline quinone (PQQ) biosynthesis protein C
MSTLNDDVSALKAEIEGYKVRLEAATTEERKDRLLEIITETRKTLNKLLDAQAAASSAAVGASGKHLPPLCSHALFCVRL